MPSKITFFSLLLLLCICSSGQFNEYAYKRELFGIKDQWYKLELPVGIFGKVLPDLSDIRIYGITGKGDTIEAPYIPQVAAERISQKDVVFNLINQSKNDRGYYYTFAIKGENPINLVKLDFGRQNFDWRITLEGSQDQHEWFTVVENYRILSIKNKLLDFRFTDAAFPSAKFRYFRMKVSSGIDPEFIAARLSLTDSIAGSFRKYPVKSLEIEVKKPEKQTIITAGLKSEVPVCSVKLFVRDHFDYYRPVFIEYVADSIKTEKGWLYNYGSLTSGTLSSVGNNVFSFNSTILKKLRIIIGNQDNKPLQIDSLVAEGNVYSLVCRFTEPASYYLVYGNHHASTPQYDLSHFINVIPAHLEKLQLGDEQMAGEKTTRKTVPLFQNKIWLWMVMALIIIVLGGFSLSLIKKK